MKRCCHFIVAVVLAVQFCAFGTIVTEGNAYFPIVKKYVLDGTEAKGQVCPNCVQESLVYQEGCLICKNSGASRCG